MEANVRASVRGDHALRQANEYLVNCAVSQPLALIRYEEGLSAREQTRPLPGIAAQWRQRRMVQRHLSRMLKLAEPNHQNALDEVDILDTKGQGFRDAQSGASQQPQQGPIGQRSKRTR